MNTNRTVEKSLSYCAMHTGMVLRNNRGVSSSLSIWRLKYKMEWTTLAALETWKQLLVLI